MTASRLGAIVSVGTELVNGDIANTNSRWLARHIAKLGPKIELMASVPDDARQIADLVRWARERYDFVVVTGGLGPTHDDVTREGIAQALGVPRRIDVALAEKLRYAGGHAELFADEWANVPAGSEFLPTLEGGAPAFAIENVYVLAGQPSEMRAAFRAVRDRIRTRPAVPAWRRTYATTEDRIAETLSRLAADHPEASIGSYARYSASSAQVELVVRASTAGALSAVVEQLEATVSSLVTH